jgi:uncharacterized protein
MKFNLDNAPGYMIVAYDVGRIQVHGSVAMSKEGEHAKLLTLTSSTIITPNAVIQDWQPTTPAQLAAAHLQQVLEFQPEIILLGTGRRLRFPAAEIIQQCHTAGTGIEVMDTGAACRTYNILAAEGRRVAAALMMIETETT